MNPRTLKAPLGRLTLLLALCGLAYLYGRYDTLHLPCSSCSPLMRFYPGDDLLLDSWPPGLSVGDAVLFRGPDGLEYLGLVQVLRPAPEGRQVWLRTDAEQCPGRDSEDFGWLPEGAVQARILGVWPW